MLTIKLRLCCFLHRPFPADRTSRARPVPLGYKFPTQFWVRGLCPSTRYGFRVRAFNGFGPGAYAHGCFATRPSKPLAPVAVKLAPNEVTLQWIFASRNAAKVKQVLLGVCV